MREAREATHFMVMSSDGSSHVQPLHNEVREHRVVRRSERPQHVRAAPAVEEPEPELPGECCRRRREAADREAREAAQAFIERHRRRARLAAADWIRPVLTGAPGESLLDPPEHQVRHRRPSTKHGYVRSIMSGPAGDSVLDD